MINKRPTISIIIPAYNVDKYLKAALDSIKEQIELPDEVILIDDGSTDGTLKIAESYEISIPYKVISIENGGQGNARNLGVKLASSEYIYFFDSDDLLTKNFIQSIKDQIQYHQYPDIILFSGKAFNDSEYQGTRSVDYRRGFSGVFSDRVKFLDTALSHSMFICSPCMYVSKQQLWGGEGLKFGQNFYEDEALFYPVLFACNTYVMMDDIFFLRRNREGSTMTMALNAKHVNGMLNCMQTSLKLYARAGLSKKEKWHISKRLEAQCVAYILRARRAGFKYSYIQLLLASIKTKNPMIFLKTVAYASKVNKVDMVKEIVRFFREKKYKNRY